MKLSSDLGREGWPEVRREGHQNHPISTMPRHSAVDHPRIKGDMIAERKLQHSTFRSQVSKGQGTVPSSDSSQMPPPANAEMAATKLGQPFWLPVSLWGEVCRFLKIPTEVKRRAGSRERTTEQRS